MTWMELGWDLDGTWTRLGRDLDGKTGLVTWTVGRELDGTWKDLDGIGLGRLDRTCHLDGWTGRDLERTWT
jgi:hypothetical protein